MRRHSGAVLVMAGVVGIGLAGWAQQNRTLDQVLSSGQEKIQKGDTNGALSELLEAIRLQNQLIQQQQQALLGLTGQIQEQQKTITEQQKDHLPINERNYIDFSKLDMSAGILSFTFR